DKKADKEQETIEGRLRVRNGNANRDGKVCQDEKCRYPWESLHPIDLPVFAHAAFAQDEQGGSREGEGNAVHENGPVDDLFDLCAEQKREDDRRAKSGQGPDDDLMAGGPFPENGG